MGMTFHFGILGGHIVVRLFNEFREFFPFWFKMYTYG